MEKFDTCFFERYAKITLTELLGAQFDDLVNMDRPDLQSPDHRSVGIEVTRAMEESQRAEQMLLGEMAGIQPCEDDLAGTAGRDDSIGTRGDDSIGTRGDDSIGTDKERAEDLRRIAESGYGYGLDEGQFIGKIEYDYWAMALPLKRILTSKIRKAANGFYGKYDLLGLYVFSKDDLTEESVSQTCEFVTELQAMPPVPYRGEVKEPISDDPENGGRYQVLYLSEVSNLYVCELKEGYTEITKYPISKEQRRDFFVKALWNMPKD